MLFIFMTVHHLQNSHTPLISFYPHNNPRISGENPLYPLFGGPSRSHGVTDPQAAWLSGDPSTSWSPSAHLAHTPQGPTSWLSCLRGLSEDPPRGRGELWWSCLGQLAPFRRALTKAADLTSGSSLSPAWVTQQHQTLYSSCLDLSSPCRNWGYKCAPPTSQTYYRAQRDTYITCAKTVSGPLVSPVFHRSLEMTSFEVYVLGPHHSPGSPYTLKGPARHRSSRREKYRVGTLILSSEIGQGGCCWRDPPFPISPALPVIPYDVMGVVLPPHTMGGHDLIRGVATALRCQKQQSTAQAPLDRLEEPRLTGGIEGAEHADAGSSCFSCFSSPGVLLPQLPILSGQSPLHSVLIKHLPG